MNTATYTCADGYALMGGSSRTCQSNAMWSEAAPVCNCKIVLLVYIHIKRAILRAVIRLSSSSMAIISNNTELSLSTIGSGSALSCHTELTTCCRDQDNPTGGALGDWIGPNRNSVSETRNEGFYVTREMSSVSLNLVEGSSDAAGSYCCRVPRSGNVTSTHCIIVTGEEGLV